MPTYEHVCHMESCHKYGVVVEGYFRNSDPTPSCNTCGQEMSRMISTFNVVFTGPITSRYNDKNLEGSHLEGYWVTEKNTPDGKERQRHIETWQDRREWMKQEGLEDAMGAPGGISSDGKSFNSRGLPGTW